MPNQSDLNKQGADVRASAAELDEHRDSLRDAMNALTQAHSEVRNDVENGRPCDLTALTAAVNDVTAAVGKATNHGGMSSARSVDTPDPVTTPDQPATKK